MCSQDLCQKSVFRCSIINIPLRPRINIVAELRVWIQTAVKTVLHYLYCSYHGHISSHRSPGPGRLAVINTHQTVLRRALKGFKSLECLYLSYKQLQLVARHLWCPIRSHGSTARWRSLRITDFLDEAASSKNFSILRSKAVVLQGLFPLSLWSVVVKGTSGWDSYCSCHEAIKAYNKRNCFCS